jgi:TDG/mug DNA glycosylase family protein
LDLSDLRGSEEAPPPPAAPEWRPGWALPDYLAPGLRLVLIGFNPGLRSAEVGHYYAYPGNRFWDLLGDAGLTPQRLDPEDDALLLGFGIGLTDIVKRSSGSSGDLSPAELRAGAAELRAKLARFRPHVAAYGGKGIYRALAGRPAGHALDYGLQAGSVVPPTIDFVLPSPSGRSGLPYREKLRWYQALAGLVGDLPPGTD